MAFKSVLTVLTDGSQMAQLDAAAALATREDAHLEAFCLGVDHAQTGYYFAGATGYAFQEAIDTAIAGASSLEAAARVRLDGTPGLRWSVESAAAQVGGLTALIALRARYADVMVQALPYGTGAPVDSEAVTEAALFEGACPVLVLPPGASVEAAVAPRRVLIAWNQSAEAMAAIRRALPLLTRADRVEITVVDPGASGPERSDPGGALCQMLVRHGVPAEIAVLARQGQPISATLMRRATETAADLMVMGAYGHSRFREAILGGATRATLEMAPVPVFMAR